MTLPISGKDYALAPEHWFQDWELFNPENWSEDDKENYTYQDEGHSVYTIQLFELIESGVFDWNNPILDWSEAAYDQEQYERFCAYFEERFRFREISIVPALEWFYALHRMLVYELMPKYRPLYKQVEDGISPLGENEYFKRRNVTSNYPETLLSGNSDYITSGDDEEFERVKIDNVGEAALSYRDKYRNVDTLIGDELEVLFVSMYTSYTNGL